MKKRVPKMTISNKLAVIVMVAMVNIIFAASCVAADWVHPAVRHTYPGYEKFKNRKKTSPDWMYATNRPRGNIHGGGTSAYRDYKLSNPQARKKNTAYTYPSPKKATQSSGCNCGN